MKSRDLCAHRRAVLRSILFGFSLLAAGGLPAQSEPLFHGVGVITGVDAASGSLTIRHEPIQGLMPAMEMAFQVEPPSLIGAAKVGDRVEFDVAGRTYTIKGLKIVAPAPR